MYPQQSHASENIWAFLLKIIVFGAFLLLGADLVKAAWLSRPIAEAQANDIRAQTEISRKNAELDYKREEFYLNLEMQRAQQQAAQELEAQAARNAEALAFQKTMHTALTTGLWIAAVALSLGLFTASLFAGIGLSRYLTVKAQPSYIQPVNGRLIVKFEQLTRQVNTLQEKITELEQRQNHRVSQDHLTNTAREWPDDPENYLSRLPPTWAG